MSSGIAPASRAAWLGLEFKSVLGLEDQAWGQGQG
jgi:hypothetical protein